MAESQPHILAAVYDGRSIFVRTTTVVVVFCDVCYHDRGVL